MADIPLEPISVPVVLDEEDHISLTMLVTIFPVALIVFILAIIGIGNAHEPWAQDKVVNKATGWGFWI